MSTQRFILFLLLTLAFVGVSTLFFSQIWNESQTRFRTGLPIPTNLLPDELRQAQDLPPSGPPRLPPIRPEDPRLSGDDQSPVTIVVFGDFQCEFCRDQAVALKDALRRTGHPNQFRVIWRDLPLINIHTQAMSAAIVGRCAETQNSFKPMHDLLFSRAEEFTDAEYLAFARQINLNEQQFLTCLRDPANTFAINQDIDIAREHAITVVPLIFVQGKALNGYVDADTLEIVLNRELELTKDKK